jgi:hypothetical protein
MYLNDTNLPVKHISFSSNATITNE